MADSWKRPESVPFPSTWDMFDGLKPLSNGQIPRFRIQDITDDLVDDIIKHYQSIFLRDEPSCACLGLAQDKEALDEMATLWNHVLKYHMGIIAILENPEKFKDLNLPKIVGCNATYPIFQGDKDKEMKNDKIVKVINLMKTISQQVDSFAKYNTSVIMYALGLSVDPIFRGQGVAERLLKARFPLGRALGVTVTTSVFTSTGAKRAAEKAGFETLVEMKPEEFKEDGVEVFKGIDCDLVKFMAAKIE